MERSEIHARINLLQELEEAYWENRQLQINLRLMERDDNGVLYCSSVIVINTEGVPDGYVKIPNGTYSNEDYQRFWNK